MLKDKYKDASFKVILSIFLIIFISFIILTIGSVFYKSFYTLGDSLKDEEVQFAIKTTLYTSSISTVICLIFSVPIAYTLARFDFYGKRIVSAIIQIPNSIPPIASGIALLLLFSSEPMLTIVTNLGIDPVFSVNGIVLAHVFINIPYMIRILRSTFEDINPKLEFIARTLGCSSWGSFFRVSLPLARNGLISAIIITWTNTLGEFGTAFMLSGAIRMKTETLPVAIFLNLSGGNLDKALACATILIMISIICLLIFEFVGKDILNKSR